MTDEEFEKIWAQCKAHDAELDAQWDALPEEEKERRRKMYSDGFYERISDDPTGGHDDEEDSIEEE